MSQPIQNRSKASSAKYWAELRPSVFSERLLQAAQSVACLFGLYLLYAANLPLDVSLLLASLWIACCAYKLVAARRLSATVRRLRVIEGGALQTVDQDGRVQSGCIADGSLILRDIAWLRLARQGSLVTGLLLLRSGQEAYSWRRFQVICRQIGPLS